MARTQSKGTDVGDGTICRVDLNVSTAGQAVISKILEVANSGIKINGSTGADAGTGDVGLILDWTTLDARWLKGSDAGYIKNQIASAQAADIWINGYGKFGGLVSAYSNTTNPYFKIESGASGSFPLVQLIDGRSGGGSWNIENGRNALGYFELYSSFGGVSGTRFRITPTGAVWAQNSIQSDWQLTSGATSGTPPFVVASSTMVTSLNADLLDGYHGADYLRNTPITAYPGIDANTMPSCTSSFSYANNALWWGPVSYLGARMATTEYGMQLHAAYNAAGRFAFRTKNGDTGTWNDWTALPGYTNASPGNPNYIPKYIQSTGSFVNSLIYDNGSYLIVAPIGTEFGNGKSGNTPSKFNINGSLWVGDYNLDSEVNIEGSIKFRLFDQMVSGIKRTVWSGAHGGITLQYTNGTNTLVDGLSLVYNGNVGIGTNSPSYKLHVVDNGYNPIIIESSSSTSYYRPGIRFQRSRGTVALPTSPTTDDMIGDIAFVPYYSGYGGNAIASIEGVMDGAPGTNSPGRLHFMTSDGASGNAVRMVIKGDGSVGIGTTAPLAKFHVSANYSIFGNSDLTSSIGSGFLMGMNATSGSSVSFLRSFQVGTGDTNGNFALQPSGGTISIGTLSASALLHLAAGTATRAPLKLTSGTPLTTAADGALEYHSSHLYFTIGTTRVQLDNSVVTATAAGMVPAFPNNTTTFLRGDGTWAVPTYVIAPMTFTQNNGVTASVNTDAATYAITLGLGAITPTSVNGVSAATLAFMDATSSVQGQLNGKLGTSANAASATKLVTARTIAGVSFDGTANISLTSKFIVQGTNDAGLSGAQFLGALGTGILKNTTSTGVLSIAANSDLPVMSATVGGAVPTPPNDATKFLNGQGGWTVPPGGVTGSGTANRLVDWATTSTIGDSIIATLGTPIITINSFVPSGASDGNLFIGAGGAAGNTSMTGTTTTSNIGIGGLSLSSLTTGYNNTAVGFNALGKNTSGYGNVGIGIIAGAQTAALADNATSYYSVYIGGSTKSSASGNTNEIVIGYNATGAGSNTVTLGSTAITNTILSGLTVPYLARTTTTTIALTDFFVDCTSGTWTATLPSAATAKVGRMYVVKNSGSGTITLSSTSGNIDGAASKSLTQWTTFRVVSDGTNWKTI